MKAQLIHRSEFVRQLKRDLPEVAEHLQGMRDSLTSEMTALTVLAEQAIHRSESDLVLRCFRFADRMLEHGNRAVRNSVAVVFLENLRFEGLNGAKFHKLLSSRLCQEWKAVHEYLHELVGAELPQVGAE